MPATDVLILNRKERLQRDFYATADCVFYTFLFLLPLALFFSMLGGIGYWMSQENIAGNKLNDAFNLRTCEVLTVDHFYNASDLTCVDTFTYTWQFVDVPVIYSQKEFRRRSSSDCLLDLDITAANATFSVTLVNKTNTCFRLLPQFEAYTEYFNCAEVVQANVSAGRCSTLLFPTTTYDSTPSIVIAVILLFCMGFSWGFCSEGN